MVYVLVGQDTARRDSHLKKIKDHYLPGSAAQFNLDTLHAKELSLKTLQERLHCLPVASPVRVVAIRGAGDLKQEIKDFILQYAQKPFPKIILVIESESFGRKDDFLARISRFAKVLNSGIEVKPDTFALNRVITSGKAGQALKMLHQLIENGEKPEMILGALRYCWEKEPSGAKESRRKLSLLVKSDLEIKTGRLKPEFSLEKLVVSLALAS